MSEFARLIRGSPPRARGHHGPDGRCAPRSRFTPACAGTSPRAATPSAASSVHPRVRGDIVSIISCARRTPGSPPRARGHLHRLHGGLALGRFTPACAGTSCRRSRAVAARTVHPRVRGDIFVCRSRSRRPSVHPRVRGDILSSNGGRDFGTGSPPRARGHRFHRLQAAPHPRFTPACAGTSCAPHARRPPRPVHPRVRGDIDVAPVLHDQTVRFTPACAGTSFQAANRRTPTSGSPPRARGHQ